MAIEHHITLEERTDTLAYASATTPPAPTMPNVKASAKKTKTFSVISLFSGCGGMDLGFKGGFDFLGKRYAKQPFKLIWANEINEAACKTYQRNLGSHIHQGDIWEMMDSLPKEADVVIGGFPCQDISVNGKGAGINGKRSGWGAARFDETSGCGRMSRNRRDHHDGRQAA
ncbi:MAG TPA: DNA cytosine methyltransferase [Rubrivivax sp.]|jgi:DNA (cytosine-5)-methyltransferase 1|nr:DNA cytosine methyltransferase [Rubrivivax sp.]